MSRTLSMPNLIERVLRHVPHKGTKPQIVKLAKELGISQTQAHAWLVNRSSLPNGPSTLKLLEWVEGKEKQATPRTSYPSRRLEGITDKTKHTS